MDTKSLDTPKPAAVALQVVFVQYDRQKYRGSLERLLGTLAALDVDCSVLVVDNLRPGDWVHQITDRLTHIGGDNSAWEFSAFDRGLAHLDAGGPRAEVYALVTDAYAAYGSAFLSLLNAATFNIAARHTCVVGWVDGWPDDVTLFGARYRYWLRTSFLVVPAAVLPIVRPCAVPIDTSVVFTKNPDKPFLPKGALSKNLKKYLVEWLTGADAGTKLVEGWHSQFRLDRDTMPFFRSKVSAILREHLLSTRLRAAGVNCCDFRVFGRFKTASSPDDLDPSALKKFGWERWDASDHGSRFRTVRYNLEHTKLPPPTTHTEPAHFFVDGWLLGVPRDRPIHLHVGSAATLPGVRNLPRPDVAQAFPLSGVGDAGFSVKRAAWNLPPGSHDVTLDLGGGPPIALGHVEVLPLFEFSCRRPPGPDSWPATQPAPIGIDGELQTSLRAESVAVTVDGQSVDAEVFLGDGVCDTRGVWVHDVVVTGRAHAVGRNDLHTLALEFTFAAGGRRAWTMPFTVSATDVSCTARTVTVGPYDPETGLTPVLLDIDVFDVEAGDRVAFERNGVRVLETTPHISSTSSAPVRRGVTLVDRPVADIPAGSGRFSLVLLRGRQRSIIWAGDLLVRYRRPEIQVDDLTASFLSMNAQPTYRLHVAGWVSEHFLVDHLIVEFGGSGRAFAGLHVPRPDVADATGDRMVARLGFDTTVDVTLPPGEHLVHLVAMQRGEERCRVSRRVRFEDPSAHYLSLESDDLERLIRGPLAAYYSSIVVRGTLRTGMNDLRVALSVDNARGDEQTFEGPGNHEFVLRAVPPCSGEHDVRLAVWSGQRLVFQSNPGRVLFQKTELFKHLDLDHGGLVADFGAILDRFHLRSKIVGDVSDEELLTRVLEAQPERVREFGRMVAAVAQRIAAARPERRWVEPDGVLSPRRLKVLFATWETPSRRHGGGVYLRKLLMRLGARHDITLVHGYGQDEIGEADSLRPHVHRIVAVPRAHTRAHYRGDGGFPLVLYDGYTPELRRVLESEVASGSYDLVDYEYSALGPYIVPGPPSVLTILELGYQAVVNTAFAIARPPAQVAGDIDRLVRSFHYFTNVLPSLCSRLLMLTDEEAVEMSMYSDARVYTSPGGVELNEDPADASRPETDAPVFAYVGNFRHPPNARAVAFFANDVMPRILQRHPLAQFHVYGPHASGAVRDLDGKNGVRVMGFVDELRPVLNGATAFVAPLFTGAGQRIKVLEALEAGALVIGTDLSVRSIRVADGTHYLRANTADEFVCQALRAVENPEEARRIARAGQERVAAVHSWDAAARRREAIWFHALSE